MLAYTNVISAKPPDVTFTSSDGSRLAGTLAFPAHAQGKLSAVLLIAGSGMMDRDETIGPNKPFLEISNALTKAGFAVLRYDKRGVGESTSTTSLFQVTRQLYLDDAHAALTLLAADPRIDASRIFILGHSEGGELAIALANIAPVRGIILLAPLPKPYSAILKEQIAKLPAAQQAMTEQMLKVNATFLASWHGIDPRQGIARVNVPMLLLHGGNDIQVSTPEIDALAAAATATHRNITSISFPNDNHLFMRLPKATISTGAEYLQPHPVDPRVLDAIVRWLRTNDGGG